MTSIDRMVWRSFEFTVSRILNVWVRGLVDPSHKTIFSPLVPPGELLMSIPLLIPRKNGVRVCLCKIPLQYIPGFDIAPTINGD